jgi:hypothetical protein
MKNVVGALVPKSRVGVAVSAVVVTAGVVTAGVSAASIPDSAGVIHGCYTNAAPHTLRVVDTATTASCPGGTTSLKWNATGPPGPPGTINSNSSSAYLSNAVAIPHTSWVTLQSVTLTIPSGPNHQVELNGQIEIRNQGSQFAAGQLAVDNTRVGPYYATTVAAEPGFGYGFTEVPVSTIVTLSPGSHTIAIEATAEGTAAIANGWVSVSAVDLG